MNETTTAVQQPNTDHLRVLLTAAKKAVEVCLDELKPAPTVNWVDREYVFAATDVKPGALERQALGVENIVPNTGIPEIPETRSIIFGVAHDFRLESIKVDDSAALNFNVISVYLAQEVLWTAADAAGVPAKYFAESAPTIPFKDVSLVPKGCKIEVTVQNMTNTPCSIKLRVIGKEAAPSEALPTDKA